MKILYGGKIREGAYINTLQQSMDDPSGFLHRQGIHTPFDILMAHDALVLVGNQNDLYLSDYSDYIELVKTAQRQNIPVIGIQDNRRHLPNGGNGLDLLINRDNTDIDDIAQSMLEFFAKLTF